MIEGGARVRGVVFVLGFTRVFRCAGVCLYLAYEDERGGLPVFRSLRVRNYRIWFWGALVSNIGAWMQATAQSWVVLTELTNNNASAVGVTMALQFGPQLLLVTVSGVVADRFRRRTTLFFTQSALMLLAAGLAALLLLGHANIWHLYAFALGLGVVNAFDTTARQTFVSDLVGSVDASNAVALNSASFNAARLIGPAFAGVLIAVVGSGWVFAINAVSFLAMLAALAFIRSADMYVRDADVDADVAVGAVRGGRFFAGFRYLGSRPDLLVIFAMVFLIGAFSMNFPVMSSTMAVEFGRGAGEYGFLSSVLAIGSLSGALLAAGRKAARMRVVIISCGGLGFSSLLSAFMPSFLLFAVSLIFFGFLSSTIMSTANGFVQTTVAPQLRGRVMALYVAVLLGGTPVGSPLVGMAADGLGARATFVISACAALVAFGVGVVWLLTARRLRLHHDSGLHFSVTHVGRPSSVSGRSGQSETLTAPLDILHRE